jgi:calcium-dependent protein kinase
MGCGAVRRAPKTHPAPEQLSVVPDAATKDSLVVDSSDPQEADEASGESTHADAELDDDSSDEDDEESDESMPGEPMEAKWARAAKRKKKLARQRRRAARAAKEGVALKGAEMSVSSFKGMRRPRGCPGKDGCFDRQCFLISGRGTVDDVYDIGINLGKGTFGSVERCTHRKSKKLHAIKTISKKKVYHPDRLSFEVEVMRVLEHPHILKLHEAFEDDKYIYIIMELCMGGELLEKVMGKSGGLSEKAVAIVMRQVVSATHYMHQQHICHRDLKPENFLLVEDVEDVCDAHVKVIDFGFSTLFEPGTFMSTRACTNNYVAPEVLEGRYTEACDVWSLGVCIYILLSGQKPFWGSSDCEMLAKVQSCSYSYDEPCWAAVSDDAKDLISRILVLNYGNRLTASNVLQHSWIEKLSARPSAPLAYETLARLHSFNASDRFKRAAMTALAQQLQEDSIRRLQIVFQTIDADSDGCLSMEELAAGLKQAGVEFAGEIHQAFQSVDSDGSGMIDYTEFLAATLDEKQISQEAACWAAFRVFDVDGDGKITKSELVLMLSCGSISNLADAFGTSRDEIEQAINDADLDGDGCIDFDEFRALLQSCRIKDGSTTNLPNTKSS